MGSEMCIRDSRSIGLADDHRAGGLEAGRNEAGGACWPSRGHGRARRGWETGDIFEVLHRHGQAVQRPRRLGQGVELSGVGEDRLACPSHRDRIDGAVDLIDPIEVRLDDIDRTDLASPESVGEFGGGGGDQRIQHPPSMAVSIVARKRSDPRREDGDPDQR